jgi:hypothetical protein
MESIIFIRKYESYLNEIQQVVKPEYQSILDELIKIDPHDLVAPDTWVSYENSASGLVWQLFLLNVKETGKL